MTRRFQSEFINNSLKLLSSNAIAQTVGLLIYPLLTRIYAPEDFGLASLFLSIGGVVTLFATAEYQYAIMLPKSDYKATAIFHTGFFMALGVALLCLLTVPFAKPIANLFNAPALSDWYFLLPVFVFVSALWALLNYWYTRHKKFTPISTYQLTQSFFGAGSKYGLGLLNFTGGGLIISTVLAPILSLTITISTAFKKTLKPLLTLDITACKTVAKEYANFPKFALPRSVVNTISGSLPILLLTPFFGLAEIGFFGMALTLAFRPINMISGSLYQVFFQRTAEHVQNKKTILPFFKKFIRNTTLIVVPSFAALYFVLPWLTEWLLGEGWKVTGEYIRIMLPWLLMSSLVAPICYVSDIFQKQKVALFFEILLVLSRIIGIFIGIYANDFRVALIGYCVGSAVVIFAQLIWHISLVINYESHRD